MVLVESNARFVRNHFRLLGTPPYLMIGPVCEPGATHYAPTPNVVTVTAATVAAELTRIHQEYDTDDVASSSTAAAPVTTVGLQLRHDANLNTKSALVGAVGESAGAGFVYHAGG